MGPAIPPQARTRRRRHRGDAGGACCRPRPRRQRPRPRRRPRPPRRRPRPRRAAPPPPPAPAPAPAARRQPDADAARARQVHRRRLVRRQASASRRPRPTIGARLADHDEAGRVADAVDQRRGGRMEVRLPRLLPRAAANQLRPAHAGEPAVEQQHAAAGQRAPLPARRRAARPGHAVAQPDPRPRLQLPGLGLHQHGPRAVDAAQLLVRQLARDGDGHRRQLRACTDGGYKQPAGAAGDRPGVPDAELPRGARRSRHADLEHRHVPEPLRHDGQVRRRHVRDVHHRPHARHGRDADRQPDQPRQRGQLGHQRWSTGFGAKYDVVPFLNNQ